MTFVIAFARPDVALLAADTRNTTVPGPGAPAVGFRDDGVKLDPWETGWMVSAPMTEWAAAIRSGVTRKAMGILKAHQPGWAQEVRDKQTTFVIGCNAAGPFRRCVNWRWREKFPGVPPHVVVAPRPVDADAATWRRLCHAYAAEIEHKPLPSVLEATARLFRAIYHVCGPHGSVSPLLSVGVVHPDGRRQHFGPQLHDAFLAASVTGAEVAP